MSYAVSRESIARAVKLATGIIPRNSPKEALKGVLLCAGRDSLTVKSTDLESARIEIKIAAEGQANWEALPPADRLSLVIAEANCQHLDLSKDSNGLYLATGLGETVLLDCDEPTIYPSTVGADPTESLTLPAEVLARSLKRVVAYCADVSTRYALVGVKFERGNGKLTLVATDGKWLGVQTLDCPSCTESSETTVVPEKAIRTLLAAMRGEEGEVTVGFSGNTVTFSVDGVTLSARTVEGRYPTWREVFPKKHDIKLPLNAGTLLSVTRQAATMCTEETRGIDYTFAKAKLTAKSSDPVAGRAKIELPIAYDGPEHTLAFDGSLMAGMLAQWDGDTELEACLVSKNTVAEFRFPDGFNAVIVPLTRGEK